MEKMDQNSLTNQIVESIITGIREGTFRPGERLASQRELAELYGVSRTIITYALKVLEGRNIIKIVDRSGAYVCDFQGGEGGKALNTTPDMANEKVTHENIDECIVMVMGESVRLIARKGTDYEIAALKNLVYNFYKKYSPKTSQQERFIHEISFHLNIVRYTHNAILQKLMLSSLEVLTNWIKSIIADYSLYKMILEIDMKIIDALLSRHEERAYWLVRERDLLVDDIADISASFSGSYQVNKDNLLIKNPD